MNWWIIVAEGLLAGVLLILFCAVGISKGAVNMVFLYHQDVQDRCVSSGLISSKKLRRNLLIFKGFWIPFYLGFVLAIVYAVNRARGFWPGFLQMFAIFSAANLIDRLIIDEYWVGHTCAWIIPGTEDMMPYITGRDKLMKWLTGTVGFAGISALLSWLMTLIMK